MNLTKVIKNTFGVKEAQPSKVESCIPGSEYMSRLVITRSDIRIWPRLSMRNTNTTLNTRAGWYDSVIVIPQYVDSPILISKFILLYNFIA